MIELSSLGELAGGLLILKLEPIILSAAKESVSGCWVECLFEKSDSSLAGLQSALRVVYRKLRRGLRCSKVMLVGRSLQSAPDKLALYFARTF